MKLNNCDFWFMSLGLNCADIPLLGRDRIKGPVDNIWIKQEAIIEDLLSNTYLRKFIANTPQTKEKLGGYNDLSYVFPGYEIFHNNPTEPKYLISLKERINTFNQFLNDSYSGINNYFILTLNTSFVDYKTRYVDETKLLNLIKILQKYEILDKVIFVEIKQLNPDIANNSAYTYINNWSENMAEILKKFNAHYILLTIDKTYENELDWQILHNEFKKLLAKELE